MSHHQKILYPTGNKDENYTPDYAVRAIVPYLPTGLVYWCPFDTDESHFVKVMRDSNLKVINSHIFNGQDFYTHEPSERWDCIVSNPPFTNKSLIFQRALSFGKPFALLMTLTWLNDAAPKRIFSGRQLELLMFEERIQYLGHEINRVTFSSAYYCSGLLPKPIMFDSLKKYGMGK